MKLAVLHFGITWVLLFIAAGLFMLALNGPYWRWLVFALGMRLVVLMEARDRDS